MNLTRRQFLKLLAASSIAVSVPAFSKTREPYVFEGEVVDYVGHCPGGFIGGKVVKEVSEWDGTGYQITTTDGDNYYDYDLANFLREIPDKFWHNSENRERYNNVHTYLREQRFGESIEVAIRKLNFAQNQISKS